MEGAYPSWAGVSRESLNTENRGYMWGRSLELPFIKTDEGFIRNDEDYIRSDENFIIFDERPLCRFPYAINAM